VVEERYVEAWTARQREVGGGGAATLATKVKKKEGEGESFLNQGKKKGRGSEPYQRGGKEKKGEGLYRVNVHKRGEKTIYPERERKEVSLIRRGTRGKRSVDYATTARRKKELPGGCEGRPRRDCTQKEGGGKRKEKLPHL